MIENRLTGAKDNLAEVLILDLRSIGEKLLHQPFNESSNGFFETLPKEVIIHIFQYLDLLSLSNVCQVSKLFQLVGSDPQLYTRLYLKPIFHLVSNVMIEGLTKKCSFLTHLDLSWCGNYSSLKPDTLRHFVKNCGQNLTNLRLNNCHCANGQVLLEISLQCENLIELSLSNCHLLEARDFEPLAGLNNLRHLNLYRTKIHHRQLCDILRKNPR